MHNTNVLPIFDVFFQNCTTYMTSCHNIRQQVLENFHHHEHMAKKCCIMAHGIVILIWIWLKLLPTQMFTIGVHNRPFKTHQVEVRHRLVHYRPNLFTKSFCFSLSKRFLKRKWLGIRLSWRNSNKRVSLSFKLHGSYSVMLMRYAFYAYCLRFSVRISPCRLSFSFFFRLSFCFFR